VSGADTGCATTMASISMQLWRSDVWLTGHRNCWQCYALRKANRSTLIVSA
jgi:hypothetical protein